MRRGRRPLASELGIRSEPQHLEGEHLLRLGERRYRFTGSAPLTSPLALAETAVAVARVELRRRLIRREEPWRSRGAGRLDSRTLGDFVQGLRSRTARATFEIVTRTVFGAEPAELSLLHFLWYSQAGGGYRDVTEFAGAAQDSRLVDGSAQLCERLADELGEAVTLGSPVHAIERERGSVVVRSDRVEVRARRAVVALAPPLAAPIDFDPSAPAARVAPPACRHGRLHEGGGRVRARVVARPRPVGPRVRRPRPGADGRRRQSRGRRAGRARGVRSASSTTSVGARP